MKTTELLEKYPLATEVIRKWFFDEMVKSVDIAEDVPEDFKQAMLKEGVSNERLAILIDAQPRTLFDVFDENQLYINIVSGVGDIGNTIGLIFAYSIQKHLTDDKNYTKKFLSRKEAELTAITRAFELLEEKLKPIDLPALEE